MPETLNNRRLYEGLLKIKTDLIELLKLILEENKKLFEDELK